MSRKVCKNCKIFVDGDKCPLCHHSNFSDSWKGRISIIDAEKSQIAKKVGMKAKGEYAIKVR